MPDEPRAAPMHAEQLEQMGLMIEMVERLRHICFEPENAAMIAVGALKDDVPRRPQEVVKELEAALKRTRSLGVRNAIRMSLRDLYRHLDMHDQAMENLRRMLAENDEALCEDQDEGEDEDKPKENDR